MVATRVSVDNFVRAETDRMFAGIQRDAGGINVFAHNRGPTPIDKRTVIRFEPNDRGAYSLNNLTAPQRRRLGDGAFRRLR